MSRDPKDAGSNTIDGAANVMAAVEHEINQAGNGPFAGDMAYASHLNARASLAVAEAIIALAVVMQEKE